MSVEITSAEELFNLLAGDDEDVPSELIRGNKVSRHEETLQEQAEMARLNKVEAWIESDKAISSDLEGFYALGLSLVEAVLEASENSLSGNIVQKFTKLMVLWLKVTKSCRLVESSVSATEIVRILELCFSRLGKNHIKASFDACMRFVSCMINVNPSKYVSDSLIVETCNKHIAKWSKVGRMFDIMSALPVALCSNLTYSSTKKEGVDMHILEFVEKLFKKKQTVKVDFPSFISTFKTKDGEINLLKVIASGVRSVKYPVSGETRDWIDQIAARDPKVPGVSTKPILLAKQLLKSL